MKKTFVLITAALLVLAGCTNGGGDDTDAENTVLTISATAVPHEEILNEAAIILEAEYNITLEVLVTDDYYLPNSALNAGDVDANYFQHIPFFDGQIADYGYDIVNAGGIHIEPIGIYSQTFESVDAISDGATVILSNSVADHGRILAVFQQAGLITLADGAETLSATLSDIVENPKNLIFRAEINPELLAQSYLSNEADLIAINSNYALAAGLNPLEDSLIIESSLDNPYVNIVAVRSGDETKESILRLIEVLKSDEIKQFIINKYEGSVVPAQ